MIGLIRVVSTLTGPQLTSHADAIAHLVPEEIVTRAIADQPHGIHDEETLACSVPKIVKTGVGLVRDGARLIIVSCAADPAVTELRDRLDVPVVGAGSAGAAMTLAAGDRVGVLGITNDAPQVVRALLGDRLVATRRPDNVHRTTDLLEPAGRDSALRAAEALAQDGAACVLFACTGLTTIGLAADVAARTGLPVIDAVLAEGSVAAALTTTPRAAA